jgi:hypothetical protein
MLPRRPGTSNSPQYYLRPTGGGPVCIDALADSSRLAHGTSELMRPWWRQKCAHLMPKLQSPYGTRALISRHSQEPASHAGLAYCDLRWPCTMHSLTGGLELVGVRST